MRRRGVFGGALVLTALVFLAGCGGGHASTGSPDKHGDITIWYSNNEQELAWGKAMVEAWNADHPDEQITAQEIPAGSSSEAVIGASIAAGNAPCLIFNTAPVAVAQFEKQGGLVDLNDFPDGKSYIEKRSGKRSVDMARWNTLGAQGWELVSVVGKQAFFRRVARGGG